MSLGQLLNEPANFEPNKNPSCIDLIFTDQPNCVIGTRQSLDNLCRHQITYCRMTFRIPSLPSFERKIWHFDRANITLIRRSISSIPWSEVLNENPDPNWQAKTFTEILLNIMSNFISNKTVTVKPKDRPRITKSIETMLNKQTRFFENFKKHGYKSEDKKRLDSYRDECKKSIDNSKESYLKQLGLNLADPKTSTKAYWKIMKTVMNKCKSPMNKCKSPRIPLIFSDNNFIINCKDKGNVSANILFLQCKPMISNSVLPNLIYLTNSRLVDIVISLDEIMYFIRNLNKGKATGPDDAIATTLNIIYENILSSEIYPDIWKSANNPSSQKGRKQLVNNYRHISLLLIWVKSSRKLFLTNYIITTSIRFSFWRLNNKSIINTCERNPCID